MSPHLLAMGLVALLASSVFTSCKTFAGPSAAPGPDLAGPDFAGPGSGLAEPVSLTADDGLSYKEQRKRDALRGFSYDGERLELVAEEAALLVGGLDAAESQRELARGRELLERNMRLEAVAAFTRAVLLAPDRGEGYEALGDALLHRRWSKRAELAYRAGVEVAPASPRLRFKLGDALMRQGRLDESLVELREAVRLDPSFGLAHARLAVELYYAHDYDGAWRAVRRAERTGGDVPPQLKVLLAQHTPQPERR